MARARVAAERRVDRVGRVQEQRVGPTAVPVGREDHARRSGVVSGGDDTRDIGRGEAREIRRQHEEPVASRFGPRLVQGGVEAPGLLQHGPRAECLREGQDLGIRRHDEHFHDAWCRERCGHRAAEQVLDEVAALLRVEHRTQPRLGVVERLDGHDDAGPPHGSTAARTSPASLAREASSAMIVSATRACIPSASTAPASAASTASSTNTSTRSA